MVPTYQKVLVTTDLSPLGNGAVPHAYALLGERGGTVILWCAVDVSGMPDPLYAQPTPGETLAEERAEIRDNLSSPHWRRSYPRRFAQRERSKRRYGYWRFPGRSMTQSARRRRPRRLM
ncbi:MAG: universal stress protein [Candidatus Methylomirabilis sp.]|nr:universal stress protein [Candidatus Methylomirabilis sp.]